MSKKTAPATNKAKRPAKPAGNSVAGPLTAKQEAFCIAYLECGNASKAYRQVYSIKNMSDASIHVAASRLLANAKITLRLQELRQPAIEAAQVTVEKVLQEAARLAFADVRKLYRPDGTLIPIHELDDDIAAAITGVDVVESGDKVLTKKYKLADKNAAIERLFKHLGMYERDNQQQVDPLAAVLQAIASRSNSAFTPVEDEE